MRYGLGGRGPGDLPSASVGLDAPSLVARCHVGHRPLRSTACSSDGRSTVGVRDRDRRAGQRRALVLVEAPVGRAIERSPVGRRPRLRAAAAPSRRPAVSPWTMRADPPHQQCHDQSPPRTDEGDRPSASRCDIYGEELGGRRQRHGSLRERGGRRHRREHPDDRAGVGRTPGSGSATGSVTRRSWMGEEALCGLVEGRPQHGSTTTTAPALRVAVRILSVGLSRRRSEAEPPRNRRPLTATSRRNASR